MRPLVRWTLKTTRSVLSLIKQINQKTGAHNCIDYA